MRRHGNAQLFCNFHHSFKILWFGAETTTVSIYKNDVLIYLATIPVGSRNITKDITALNILEERAEEIKKSVGNANVQPSDKSVLIYDIN